MKQNEADLHLRHSIEAVPSARNNLRRLPAAGLLLLAGLSMPGCGNSRPSNPARERNSVPAEFRPVCGHPGSHVEALRVPETIPHALCDLTGVVISYKDYGGATVPKQAGGIGTSNGFTLEVAPHTLDVTINAYGQPGNA